MIRLVLVLLLLVPAAVAQSTATAELEVRQALDTTTFLFEAGPGAGAPFECDAVAPYHSPDGRAFTFEEGVTEEGCGVVRTQVVVPQGAQSLTLDFLATRTREPTADVNLLPPEVIADLRIGDATDAFLEEATDGQIHPIAQTVVPSSRTVEIRWTFEDMGPGIDDESLAIRLAGYAVGIYVQDPVVTFTGINTLSNLELIDHTVHRDEVDQHLRATATVPDVAGAHNLVFQISNAWSIDHVEIPDGRTLDLDAFDSREEDGVLYLNVPGDVLAEFGPGTYTAVFASTRALEATNVLVPFILILALAPIGTGILATRGAHRFRARAVGSYQNTARMLTNAIYLVWAGYAALGAFVFIGRMWPLIVSWPIQVEAALVHGGFVVTALAFVVLHLSWRRQLDDAMQEELLDKELSNRDLKRSNDELEQFAYIASHDLQEPLRTVARFTQLLERRYGDQMDDDAREFMAYSVDGAQRMQALLDDLLKYSRIGSSGAPLVHVDLGEALHRVTTALDGRIQDTGATVEHDDLPAVLGDARQLEQVLLNLVGNALKFCAPGVAPRVHVHAEREGRLWAIHVDDNGIGIPPEHHERIFTVFQRLHARDAYEGTGIGLAICKKIVERHGGAIRVGKGPDGTRFTFTVAPA